MEYVKKQIAENFWCIEQNGVRSFLFIGTDDAVLVDTCFGGDLKSVVESITDLPITLITTHGDRDHIGSDEQFETHFMHPAEFEIYHRKNQKKPNAYPLWEGDVFRVGEYALEVVLNPGHTPGGIALLEREHKFILCGDSVQAHTIYMHGDGRNMQALYYSLEKLQALRDSGAFDTVYASHGQLEVPADILEEHLTLAQQLLDGTAEAIGDAPDHFLKTVKTYGYGRVKMYFEMK